MSLTTWYEPTAEHLHRLSAPGWCCSYSGGKDSTSLVTWAEWLRRTGRIDAPAPRLVQSDTGVEYPELQAVSDEMMQLLTASGWACTVVGPEVRERLYCRILGLGLPPIHPGIRNMRWCTRSTKIDPVNRWRADAGLTLTLTGLRLGESSMRDGKILKRGGCAAGGECGIPDPSEDTYSPLLRWTTCQVIDWLNGAVAKDVQRVMADVFAVTRKLVAVYGVRYGQETLGDWADREVMAARFGCVGCPAIQADASPPRSVVEQHGADSPIGELYAVWFEARRRTNRCYRPGGGSGRRAYGGFGPVRMAVRPLLFDRVMDIQRRAGVVLVTPEDEAFIRQCWAEKRYPRGWSEADEATPPPSDAPLFDHEEDAPCP